MLIKKTSKVQEETLDTTILDVNWRSSYFLLIYHESTSQLIISWFNYEYPLIISKRNKSWMLISIRSLMQPPPLLSCKKTIIILMEYICSRQLSVFRLTWRCLERSRRRHFILWLLGRFAQILSCSFFHVKLHHSYWIICIWLCSKSFCWTMQLIDTNAHKIRVPQHMQNCGTLWSILNTPDTGLRFISMHTGNFCSVAFYRLPSRLFCCIFRSDDTLQLFLLTMVKHLGKDK